MRTAMRSAADIEEVGCPEPAAVLQRIESTRSCCPSWRANSRSVVASASVVTVISLPATHRVESSRSDGRIYVISSLSRYRKPLSAFPPPCGKRAEVGRYERVRERARCPLPTFALCLCLGGGLRHGCADLYDGGLEDLDLHVTWSRARGLGGLGSGAGHLALAGVQVRFGVPYSRHGEAAALAVHTRDR